MRYYEFRQLRYWRLLFKSASSETNERFSFIIDKKYTPQRVSTFCTLSGNHSAMIRLIITVLDSLVRSNNHSNDYSSKHPLFNCNNYSKNYCNGHFGQLPAICDAFTRTVACSTHPPTRLCSQSRTCLAPKFDPRPEVDPIFVSRSTNHHPSF